MSTTPTPHRGRRVAALVGGLLAATLLLGGIVAVVASGEQPTVAGADPTTTSTAGPATSSSTAPATTTTIDPGVALRAWYEALDPADQLRFRLFTGSDDDRSAFARMVTPTTTTTVAPTTTTTAPPPPPTTTTTVAPTTTTTAPPPPPTAAPAPSSGPANAFLACVVQRESRGNYQAVNPSSGAGGAYQFLQSTWNNTVRHAGRHDLVGVHPSNASPADQDAMALHLLNWYGPSPWAGPGC